MPVAGNDHQFARGPGSLQSSRLRQPRGRDVPYRPAEEHEADIKDARIESWNVQKSGGGHGGSDGCQASSETARQVDRSRAFGCSYVCLDEW